MKALSKHILVIDDDLDTCNFLREIFEDEGFKVSSALDADAALDAARSRRFDLIVSDINLNDRLNGIALLKTFRDVSPSTQVILISGFGTLETAIESVREGAFDFISKPFNVQEVIAVSRRAIESGGEEASAGSEDLKELHSRYASSGLVGHSRQMIELYKEVARVAAYRSTVLIIGESGTGKELVARAIHSNSPRAAQPFVAVNCGALAETLLEAELFGHTRGSFTGAIADKKGLFEEAEGGTIFLDEIGETSAALQVKLLRALQEGEIRRVGATKSVKVDARVIAATNRNLEDEVKAGRFREDLYYRLSVITLRVPPLRERREDIPILARYFMRVFSGEHGRRPKDFSSDALDSLVDYSWPGNVRELRNEIERLVIMVQDDSIQGKDLSLPNGNTSNRASTLHEARAQYEREFILSKLKENNWNVSQTARLLGLERSYLYRKMKTYGIEK